MECHEAVAAATGIYSALAWEARIEVMGNGEKGSNEKKFYIQQAGKDEERHGFRSRRQSKPKPQCKKGGIGSEHKAVGGSIWVRATR